MPAADEPDTDGSGRPESGTGAEPSDAYWYGGWDRPGRSVFDDPPPTDAADDAALLGTNHDTDVLPVVQRRRPGRAVLDGAAFGVYEEEERRSRAGVIVGSVLAVAFVLVGALVWRAVNADARLDPRAADAPTTTRPEPPAPTIEALRALIPPGLDTCVPFGDPELEPPRVAVLCPRSGVPDGLAFVLYGTVDDREAEFDRLVSEFGVPTTGTDCALGQSGTHDYIGVTRVGRVACLSGDGEVDFVWTSDEAPLLARARGGGAFSDHYAFWDRVVDRTDARFPRPAERDLLDQLPDALTADCRRDLDLNVATAGLAAVVCDTDDAAPDLVSSARFRDADAMSAWINSARSSLTSNVFGQGDDACTPSGFGRPPVPETTTTTATTTTDATDTDPTASTSTTGAPPTTDPPEPTPDAGFTTYDLDGRTGRILCFVSSSHTNTLFWIRDGSLIGSIAVSDRRTGASMRDLLEWWESGGHRP